MSALKVTKFGAEVAQRQVLPIISNNSEEARARVLAIYKKWQRRAPNFWWDWSLDDMPLPALRLILKQQFMKNAHIKDVRIVDRLVEQAKLDLSELDFYIYNSDHVRNILLKENLIQKPKDFLSKFLNSKD